MDASLQPAPTTADSPAKAVVIGASTGGPSAVSAILQALPDTLAVPVFVGQHMSPNIIPEFVHSLSQGVGITVQLANQNEVIVTNHIYVAPGDMDTKLILDPLGNLRILLFPPSTTLTPSIDVLMASVETVYGAHSLGIILTGMGVDGLEGMRAIKAVGGRTIVQDEATSAVYGMAQAVNNEHLADAVLPLQAIAEAIISWSTAS